MLLYHPYILFHPPVPEGRSKKIADVQMNVQHEKAKNQTGQKTSYKTSVRVNLRFIIYMNLLLSYGYFNTVLEICRRDRAYS